MPNNQNFLLDMWNETPWMIPVMILMWVGMIAFVRWVIKLNKRRCKSHRETYVVVFMIVAACATGIGTYLLYRGPNLLGAVCAFLFMGGIVGGCVGSVWLDPIGAANGIVVGIGLSAIFFVLEVFVTWSILANLRIVPPNPWEGRLVLFTLAELFSICFGSMYGLRLSVTKRPRLSRVLRNVETTER